MNHVDSSWQSCVIYNAEPLHLRLFSMSQVDPDDPAVVRSAGFDRLDQGRRFGDVWLGLWLWKLLGLDEIVERHMPQGEEQCGLPTSWPSR